MQLSLKENMSSLLPHVISLHWINIPESNPLGKGEMEGGGLCTATASNYSNIK